MDGAIGTLIASPLKSDKNTVKEVFGPRFREMGDWRAFLRITLGGNVSTQLAMPYPRWSVKSFHALYIACWIHHPVEKGTFMINLAKLSQSQRDVVKEAYTKHCSGRKSSHLSGSGRSASQDWAFLNGYHELLVQFEYTKGQPYLFLKSEGHTTGVAGIVPHMQSYLHKRKHGEGLQASPALNSLAQRHAGVEVRAAENYGKHYKRLLKDVLGFSGKQVTVREAVQALFEKTGFPVHPNRVIYGSNKEVGDLMMTYCEQGPPGARHGIPYRVGGKITGDMIEDLKKLAKSMQADGNVHMPRVYREIRVEPAQLDESLNVFYRTVWEVDAL